jgi:branched-chain amino acid transport system substrate-binding protein
MINDQGGVNGRRTTLVSLDDGYAPPKTVEQTRKLVEQERVALLFSSIGTAPNTAVQKYLNDRNIPQIFTGSGASKWGNIAATANSAFMMCGFPLRPVVCVFAF